MAAEERASIFRVGKTHDSAREVIAGRRDWDVVAFADYQSDMQESALHAAGIITGQREHIERLKRIIATLVIDAGGTLMATETTLARAERASLEITYCPSDAAYRYRAMLLAAEEKNDARK